MCVVMSRYTIFCIASYCHPGSCKQYLSFPSLSLIPANNWWSSLEVCTSVEVQKLCLMWVTSFLSKHLEGVVSLNICIPYSSVVTSKQRQLLCSDHLSLHTVNLNKMTKLVLVYPSCLNRMMWWHYPLWLWFVSRTPLPPFWNLSVYLVSCLILMNSYSISLMFCAMTCVIM